MGALTWLICCLRSEIGALRRLICDCWPTDLRLVNSLCPCMSWLQWLGKVAGLTDQNKFSPQSWLRSDPGLPAEPCGELGYDGDSMSGAAATVKPGTPVTSSKDKWHGGQIKVDSAGA